MIASTELWTYRDLQRVFKRSYPTLYLWQRYHGMPAVRVSGRAFGFVPSEVVRWAQLTGRIVYLDELESLSPSPMGPAIAVRAVTEAAHG